MHVLHKIIDSTNAALGRRRQSLLDWIIWGGSQRRLSSSCLYCPGTFACPLLEKRETKSCAWPHFAQHTMLPRSQFIAVRRINLHRVSILLRDFRNTFVVSIIRSLWFGVNWFSARCAGSARAITLPVTQPQRRRSFLLWGILEASSPTLLSSGALARRPFHRVKYHSSSNIQLKVKNSLGKMGGQ